MHMQMNSPNATLGRIYGPNFKYREDVSSFDTTENHGHVISVRQPYHLKIISKYTSI